MKGQFMKWLSILVIAIAIVVMIKDKKHTSTGGWMWQAWAGGDQSKPLVTDAVKQCFECHQPRKDQDYVYSTYIP
jgi:hypothetical protein